MNTDNMTERTKSAEEVRGIACERDLDWVISPGWASRRGHQTVVSHACITTTTTSNKRI
jgi:hypothetical protein